jgi:ADP-ribose pyrophosphatase YjhB (NUDIX family)
MAAAREFPEAPRVGVGAVVLDGERVLLARRGRAPGAGKWSIPGGLVDLGERLEEAAVREVEEESGLRVRLLGLCGVIDRVVREQDAVRYHYVIIDYIAECVGGLLEAGSDAAEVRWVAVGDLGQYDTTEGLTDMVQRALAIQRAMSSQPGGSNR